VERIVACVPDLMDRSKISAAAGGKVKFVLSPADLPTAAAVEGVRVVVVDLNRPGILDTLPLITKRGVSTIGFANHVDRELLHAARAAGCGEVMARSAFFTRLPDLLGAAGAA